MSILFIFCWFLVCSWLYLLLQTHMELQFQICTTRSQFPLPPTSGIFTWVLRFIELLIGNQCQIAFWFLISFSSVISVYFALNLEYGLVCFPIWKRYCEVLLRCRQQKVLILLWRGKVLVFFKFIVKLKLWKLQIYFKTRTRKWHVSILTLSKSYLLAFTRPRVVLHLSWAYFIFLEKSMISRKLSPIRIMMATRWFMDFIW
jgi:hypothetical protein